MGWSPITIKPRANGRKIVGQQLPTLLDVTCWVRLLTLLHVVGSCGAKFETSQTFLLALWAIYLHVVNVLVAGRGFRSKYCRANSLGGYRVPIIKKKVGVTPHGWLFWHRTSYKREQTKTFQAIFRTLYWVWENNKSLIKIRILFHKITHLERRGGKANPPIIDGNYKHTLF